MDSGAPDSIFDAFRDYRDLLVQSLRFDCHTGKRWIYATRRGYIERVLLNNTEVEVWFNQHGFEVVDFGNLAFDSQVMLARKAEVVVGLHGSNLTNIMFMRPGGCVVELLPTYKSGDGTFRQLSRIFDLQYTCIHFPGDSDTLDLALLDEDLERLLNSITRSTK